MRVLVNALSVTNQSGRHVLMGHLNQLRRWSEGTHEFAILFHETNRDMVVERPGFEWIACPAKTASWFARSLWEPRHLDRISRERRCDFIFTPAGISAPGVSTPQVVLCQNPWCMVRSLHHTWKDRAKALLQRRAYRRTVRHARLMVFNSEYMRDAYRQNAGYDPDESLVVYQGISEATWEAADRLGKSLIEPNHIVSVSAMAPHKGADVLVHAVKELRNRGVPAKLTFAGGWPDKAYRQRVERDVSELELQSCVKFCGWISDEELLELYSKAHVFCLLSRCESFGIPAVEAQSFGTPTLGTDTCAIPEIGGTGGLYSTVDDANDAANQLQQLLMDEETWQALSHKARQNAERFRWEQCSRPLMSMFDVVQPER